MNGYILKRIKPIRSSVNFEHLSMPIEYRLKAIKELKENGNKQPKLNTIHNKAIELYNITNPEMDWKNYLS